MSHDDLTLIAETMFNDKHARWEPIYDVCYLLIDREDIIIDCSGDSIWEYDSQLDVWTFDKGAYNVYFEFFNYHLCGTFLEGNSQEVKMITEMLEMMEV